MFDHLSLGVEDLDRAAEFYDACLAPLGYLRLSRNARREVERLDWAMIVLDWQRLLSRVAFKTQGLAPAPGFRGTFPLIPQK